eukprot:g43074.t1
MLSLTTKTLDMRGRHEQASYLTVRDGDLDDEPRSPKRGFCTSWGVRLFAFALLATGMVLLAMLFHANAGSLEPSVSVNVASDEGNEDTEEHFKDSKDRRDEKDGSDVECDVVIVGAGVGGLISAYRLAPLYGDRLCIVDDRSVPGGKVWSEFYDRSTSERPVWTPTHAEQLRSGDTILRCLAQELGTVHATRGGSSSYFDVWTLGVNTTGYRCSGETPQLPPRCDWGLTYEAAAPNGYLPTPFTDLPNPCGNLSYKDCSYENEYFNVILDPANVATIQDSETFSDYVARVLSPGAVEYLTSVGIEPAFYTTPYQAKYMIEYLLYDNDYGYASLPVPHGGPQEGILLRVADKVAGHGARFFLGERVESVDRQSRSDYAYAIKSSKRHLRAKKVVMSIPAAAVRKLKGKISKQLKETPFLRGIGATHACTWNAFFPTKWWLPRTSQCVGYGICSTIPNYSSNTRARQYPTWSYWDTDAIKGFVQYVGTPERQEGNLLRFFWENEECRALDEIHERGGEEAVQAEVMNRVRRRFTTDGHISEPIQAYYSSEVLAYTYLQAGAAVTSKEVFAWAVQPLPDEDLCLASESYNPLDAGWMEAAARSAHACLSGPVFGLDVSQTEICASPNGRILRPDDDSVYNRCLLLRNEYNMRDLAGLNSCGGPDEYDYPTKASFSNSFRPNALEGEQGNVFNKWISMSGMVKTEDDASAGFTPRPKGVFQIP